MAYPPPPHKIQLCIWSVVAVVDKKLSLCCILLKNISGEAFAPAVVNHCCIGTDFKL